MKTVVVFSESLGNACEMIAGAKALGEAVVAIHVGGDDDAAKLVIKGADKVYLLEKEQGVVLEAYAQDIAEIVAEENASLLMVGMTNRGRTIAAMVAQRMQAPCVSECKDLYVNDEGRYVVERKIYGGVANTTEICSGELLVVTVPMRAYESLADDVAHSAEIVKLPRKGKSAIKLLEARAKEGDNVDITAASTVVLFGRGVEKQEDMPMIESLAEALGGVTACTRPIAVDYKWMPHSRYIGLSGKSVKSKLYVDIGSSGQIQQIAGAQDCKIIVAINNNAGEPIFKVCDYGVVADLYEAVPILTALVNKLHS